MTSVILELLETEGRGTYLCGKLCFPEWAPEVRESIRNGFACASAPIPLDDEYAATVQDTAVDQRSYPESTTSSQVSEADNAMSHTEELA